MGAGYEENKDGKAPEGPWKQVFASGNVYLQGEPDNRIFSKEQTHLGQRDALE